MTGQFGVGIPVALTSLRRLPAIVLLARFGLIGCLLGTAFLAFVAISPGFAATLAGFPAAVAASDSWLTIAVFAAVGLAAWYVVAAPDAAEKRGTSLPLVIGLGATSLILGIASYWNCAGEQAPFWTPLSWSVALFLGSVQDPFGTTPGCPAGVPLALQLARLAALATVSVGIAGVLAVLFREQIDRMRVRSAHSLIVFVGLDEESLPLVRRLRAESPHRTRMAAFFDDGADSSLRDAARGAGCAVITTGFSDPRTLTPLVRRRGRFAVVALYALAPDSALNVRNLRAIQAVAGRVGMPQAVRPRASIRIDDPWQAEYWRRLNIDAENRWLLDAVSVYENTARIIVDRVLSTHTDRLAILGDSSLAFAMLTELAQRQRELKKSRFDKVTRIPSVVLVGPQSASLAQQHLLRQERFGNRDSAFVPDIIESAADWPVMKEALAASTSPAVVITGTDQPAEYASALAARHPEWSIFACIPGAKGLVAESMMEKLSTFGLILGPSDGGAIDAWERAARIAHANYLFDMGWRADSDPDLNKPALRDWAELSTFYRESNVRLITTTLASATAVGRRWDAIALDYAETPDSEAQLLVPAESLTPNELTTMAQLEHESWMQHHLDNGWSRGPVRDEAARKHPLLVPWSELGEEGLARSRSTVADALRLLSALGYHSVSARGTVTDAAPDTETGRWRTYSRGGNISAVRVDEDFTWATANGDTMAARAGDWQVCDERGRIWSVAPSVFAASYEQVEGNTWARTGQVLARPGVPGEVVHTLEGDERVSEGDWVLRGAGGELWSVPAEHFREAYSRA